MIVLEKKDLYKKIVNIVLDILIFLFGIVLFISIYNNIQINLFGNKYSSFFGYSTFEVQTGSMSPTINPGDWIIVKKSQVIHLNDIVTYERNNEFITHRVIESYKGTFVTQGDANNTKDAAINQDQIVGVVVKILPSFGIIRKTLFNPVVLIALIITVYLCGYVLRSDAKGEEKNSKIKNLIDDFIGKAINKAKELEKVKDSAIETEAKDSSLENNEAALGNSNYDREEKNKETEKDIANSDNLKDDEEEAIEEDELIEEDKEIPPEDVSQTMVFRMVAVDKNELDNSSFNLSLDTLNGLEDSINDDAKSYEANNDEVEERMKIIKNKRKKFKNIIEKSMYIKKEEINEIIDILNNFEKYKTNEATIKDEILNNYVDGKYYNFCGNVNVEYVHKNSITKIDSAIKETGAQLIKKYRGSDNKYKEKVDRFVKYFLLINNFENVFNLESDINSKREAYGIKIKKILKEDFISEMDLKIMINKIIKVQKIYTSIIKKLLEEQSSSTFQLDFSKITNKKNFFYVFLAHNINFSKVYSDYIVDKTYTSGVIAEDKSMILLNLLSVKLLDDMYNAVFNEKYFISLPISLYSKSTKLDKVLSMISDEFAKNNVIIAVEYDTLVANKKKFNDMKKSGYHLAVVFNEDSIIKSKDQKNINIADYVFMKKNMGNEKEILEKLTDDLKKSIIYDDILNKTNISDGGK